MSKNSSKGKLLEKIVANLHFGNELKVETNAFLPTRNGKGKREIDVLITGSVSGYLVRWAIECKNVTNSIDVPYISGFEGKLNDINIPHQHGIFVSTSPYTEGAKRRAEELGIQTFLLEGLTADGLSEAVAEAIQSVVYLLLDVREFSFIEESIDNNEIPSRQGAPIFQIDGTEIIGTIHDLIWRQWMHGQPTSVIGEYELNLPLPETWREARNQVTKIRSCSAKVQVIGLVLTIAGEVRQHSLRNTVDQSVQKKSIKMVFDRPDAKITLHNIYSETELKDLLADKVKPAILVGRVRIPRIKIFSKMGYMYFPLSETTVMKVSNISQTMPVEDIQNAQNVDPTQIEGTDFAKLWEPVWEKYPINKILDLK